MTTMFSVELVVDGAADAAVRADWAALVEAGLPSQARHTGSSNRPHVTLALAATAPGPVRERLAALARDLPVPVTAGSVLIFGGRRFVLARLAGPSVHLLDLQRRVVGALDDPVDRHGTFTAGAWTPHLTLARRLTAAQVAAALAVLGPAGIPGRLDRMRLWDMSERQEHWLA